MRGEAHCAVGLDGPGGFGLRPRLVGVGDFVECEDGEFRGRGVWGVPECGNLVGVVRHVCEAVAARHCCYRVALGPLGVSSGGSHIQVHSWVENSREHYWVALGCWGSRACLWTFRFLFPLI